MRVSYVTMLFPAASETFARRDIAALRRKGIEIEVYSLRPKPPDLDRYASEKGMKGLKMSFGDIARVLRGIWVGLKRPVIALSLVAFVIRYNVRNLRHLVRSLVLVPRCLDIFDDIDRKRPDVVHMFWGHYPSIVGYLVEKYIPTTVVSLFLGAYDLRSRYGGSAPVAQRADVVWTHSKTNIAAIKALGISVENVMIAYRGIDLSSVREILERRSKVRRRIVTAGRLVAEKGFDDVLRAFALIVHDFPDASLVILGDGRERNRLEELAEHLDVAENVDFVGHVGQLEVLEHMASAEVFLFMSHIEMLPNVVKEAMACRCLCVVSDTPGITELVTPETGFVVKRGDFEGAAQIIKDVFAGRVVIDKLINAGVCHIEKYFDVDVQMGRYISVWRNLVNQKSRSNYSFSG